MAGPLGLPVSIFNLYCRPVGVAAGHVGKVQADSHCLAANNMIIVEVLSRLYVLFAHHITVPADTTHTYSLLVRSLRRRLCPPWARGLPDSTGGSRSGGQVDSTIRILGYPDRSLESRVPR